MMKASKSSLPLLPLYESLGWMCCCWWAILPFSMGMANVFLAICSVLSLVIMKKETESILPVLLLPGSVLLSLSAISLAWSNDLLFGFKEMKTLLPLLLSSLVTYAVVKFLPQFLKLALDALLVSCLLSFLATSIFNLLPYEKAVSLHEMFGGMLQPFNESNTGLFGWYVPFMVRTQYGNLLSMAGLAALFYGFMKQRYLYLWIGLLFWLMVLILGLRGSVLGIASVLVVLFLFYVKSQLPLRPKNWWWIPFVLIILPVGYFALENGKSRWSQTKFEWEVIQSGDYLSYEYQHFTLLTRLVSWKNGLELWKSHPLTGTGIGDYKKEYALSYKNDPVEVPLYHHSQWLWFLGVFGSVGLLAFLFLYGKWLISNMKHPYAWMYGLGISAYCFMIWIFDAGMLSQTDMMSFGLFTTLSAWFGKDHI